MRRCVIFCASPEFDREDALRRVRKDDYIIACDGGYAHALACGLRPDALVGDFDSYHGEIPSDIPVFRSVPEKDDTDGMLAVKLGVEKGCDDFLMLGATGGRLDHMLGNLACAAYIAKKGMRCGICDGGMTLTTLCGGARTRFAGMRGRTVSVLSHTDLCEGVTISGMRYPLRNAELTNTFPLGVSNVITEDEAWISCEKGVLFVIVVEGKCV